MTDLNRASIYVPITSITKADEGRTRIVTGVAASDRLDYDGERASYDWFKKELSDWFRVGNMRQDHRAGGVGKALSLEFDDAAKTATVTSKAVDPDTVLKLDEKILTGYSWGAKSVPGNPIRVRKDAAGTPWVESGKIVEVSYVDHPANPDCFVSLVKSAGKQGLRRSKILADLAEGDIPGGQDFDAILKALLADIEKRDVSAAERERLGDQGHAIDTGQDHPSYPINSEGDLKNAISAYGRANPGDRAKLRRHIISEAKRLGRSDLIPDGWKSVGELLKQASCGCCDDCGASCQGDCCDQCTMGPQKAAAPGPAGILAGVTKLAAEEPDPEYRSFLGKVATAVEGWSRTEGVSVEIGTYATLATLSKAAAEPDLEKRRTFYSQAGRANVEQVLQQLHQALGVFMMGAGATDADKDQRDNTLTGQDAPAPGDTPGGPGTAPHDGVSGDGNMAFDPELVRDGDPAVRTPDGQRDGRAQGEAGTHTWPPAGDAPGPGPGDQGKGEAPGGKGKRPFDGQQQAPDRSTPRGQVAPSKAAKRLKKAKAELQELRKAAAPQPNGQPPVTVTTTLADRGKSARRRSGKTAKGIRQEIKALGEEMHKALDAAQRSAASGLVLPTDPVLEKRISRRLRKLEKRLAKSAEPVPVPAPNPLEAQIAELRAVIAGQASKGATPDTQNSDATLLLMADLTRAAFDQARKDSTEHATWLGKRVKRTERRLRKAAEADRKRLGKMATDLEALGRLPHPGGPQVARPTDKNFPVNDTIERSLPPDVLKRLETYKGMAESSVREVSEMGKELMKGLTAEVRG